MKRDEILATAIQCVTVDRAATHGDAERTFDSIAEVWTWWMSRRGLLKVGQQLTDYDAAMMMSLFKHARAAGNPAHLDNYVDGPGYMSIAGEFATE